MSNVSKQEKSIEKISFLENVRILLEVRENVLNSFRSNVFPLTNSTPGPTPNPTPNPPVHYKPKQTRARSRIPKIEIYPFKLNEAFANEIRNDEGNINTETLREYFWYQNPSFFCERFT